MSTPADFPAAPADDRDPVQEAREYLEQALAALDRLRDVLPPPSRTSPPDTRGGGPS